MKRNALVSIVVIAGLSAAAGAGTVRGKVSGVPGESVVYVDTIARKSFPAPTQHPVICQRGLTFQPHVMVVQAGTTVDFLNSDNVAHNVSSTAIGGTKKLGHNLGTWPKGDKEVVKFGTAGCHFSAMFTPRCRLYLVVVPHSLLRHVRLSGNYKIENVPDGGYTVTAWHEGAKNQFKPVAVSGEGKVDFALSK